MWAILQHAEKVRNTSPGHYDNYAPSIHFHFQVSRPLLQAPYSSETIFNIHECISIHTYNVQIHCPVDEAAFHEYNNNIVCTSVNEKFEFPSMKNGASYLNKRTSMENLNLDGACY